MASCGPFGRSPGIAVAVSGGADSLALAWLARRWATDCGATDCGAPDCGAPGCGAPGCDAPDCGMPGYGMPGYGPAIMAIVVDHGIRAESAGEAGWTAETLAGFGVPAAIVRLSVAPGPELSARARTERMAAIQAECVRRGIVHVLLGHHAADQAETVAMRLLRGSGPAGLAAMPAVREGVAVRWLRPLLGEPSGRLRATLRAAGLDWVRDPSNADPASLRARLRTLRADPDGDAPSTLRAVEAASARGVTRAGSERVVAAWLAERATVHEAGFVVLHADPPPAVLSAVVRAVGGSRYDPASASVARWCARPRAATLGGVAIHPAGRLGPGWLVVREPAAIRAGNPVWDRRWRLGGGAARDMTLPPRVRKTRPPENAVWVGPAICPAPFAPPSATCQDRAPPPVVRGCTTPPPVLS